MKDDEVEDTGAAAIEYPHVRPKDAGDEDAGPQDAGYEDAGDVRPPGGGDSFAHNSFSESSHVIELFASENAGYPFAASYDIPSGHDADTLVVLPVDGESSFLYWEISRATIAALQNRLGTTEPDLAAAVFELRGDDIALLEAFHVEEISGKRYVKRSGSMFAPLAAVIGAIKDDEFHDILISRTVDSPYFRTPRIRPDMWLEKLRSAVDALDAVDILKIHPPAAVRDETSKAIAREMGFTVDTAPEGADGPDKSRVRPSLSSGMIFGGREEK